MVVVVRMRRLIIVVVVVVVMVMSMVMVMVMVMLVVVLLEGNRQDIIFVYGHNDESDHMSCLRSENMYQIHLIDIIHICMSCL